MAQQRQQEFVRKEALDEWLKEHNISTADDVLDHFALVLLDGEMPKEARDSLAEYLNHDIRGATKPFKLTPESVSSKVRGVLHMMMTMPEFQLA